MYLIYYGDLEMMHAIARNTWSFSETHEPHADNAIVLLGKKLEDKIMYWATWAFITIMLQYIEVTI
jgi:hypothetical protein